MTKDDRVIPILEALWLAKKALECMPQLPKNMKPSHIRVLHVIYKKYSENGSVRVSDVSTAMQITKPSITKLINELVDIGTVKKTVAANDKRIVQVELSPLGRECVQKYVLDYHAKLADYFSELDQEKYFSMIETIEFVYQSMKTIAKRS
ncbi:MarR family winged helix-turn-helix transcriptional regulator [Sporomusa sp. KB1]|uniref:MarR family winged helix-turn-helix transcriptional regulator n=1 Tax=Sporomusa sp. KB1 TaxID=943346 RepID=UPI0011A742EE|nr:MarR family transcriptional regulator [Sporomusa sp. KB1]TWH45136.1 DNA-binding MarR family transcriptional regulator [Sporomusa sp. KB1]